MTIADCLQRAAELQSVSDTARLDVEVLLSKALDKPRAHLYTWPDRPLDATQLARFSAMLEKRKRGEPIAHVLGEREFWSLLLKVDNSTLIPRPETEMLVETALGIMPERGVRALDLGTGTGAVALALATERPAWTVLAVDSSPPAVNLAIENARRLRVDNIQIARSHWFDNVAPGRFDLIVSNPPYIDSADPHLEQGDVRYEPRSALVADNEGLADLEYIVVNARRFLNAGGWLLLEHGFEQGETVRCLFRNCGYRQVNTRQDIAGLDRVSLGQQPEKLHEQ